MQVVSSTGTTTLTAAITNSATAVSVASGVNLAPGVVIQVGTELMQITAQSGLNLTVTRGYNGTTAAGASSGAAVTIMAGVRIGTLMNSTTLAAAASLAVTFAQIRIDGSVLSGSGTACTTDSWGKAWLFTSLTAGPHSIECQTSTTLPWDEPCFYVGSIGQTALNAAGLNLAVPGNVASGSTPTSTAIQTNLPGTMATLPLYGQIVSFTSGGQIGKAYYVQSGSNVSGLLKLTMTSAFAGTAPVAGDAFVLSNVATANALLVGLLNVPQNTAALIIDMGDNYGGDGSPIATANGVPLLPTTPPTGYGGGTPPSAGTIATALVNALITAGVLQYVSGSIGPLQFTAQAEANVPTPPQITTVEVVGRC